MSKTLRVLQFTIGGPDFTGIASFLYQYYQKMNQKRVHFDFLFGRQNSLKLVCNDPVFKESRFIELNAVKSGNAICYYKLYKGLKQELKKGRYDVFHINTSRVGVTLLCVLTAKRCKVPIIISHSHNVLLSGHSAHHESIRSYVKHICSNIIRRKCDYIFACSKSAGESLYGKEGIMQKNYCILKNAIDTSKYSFDTMARDEVRKHMGVSDNSFVIGQVGRLETLKNQSFSIRVFADIVKEFPDSELWLIGSGKDQDKLISEAAHFHISDKVRFLGERPDVCRLMQGMDVFLFPSTYEGLGIVAIEAQAAGLPTYASDTIPKETNITDLIHYLPLTVDPKEWAQQILKERLQRVKRTSQQKIITEGGYDIIQAARWLEDFYVEISH